MYLAPLNYDRYFKKVFSDLKIAKRFLEDFLDIEIQEITAMPLKRKITDDARSVEFDFRCKIADSYVIIDMQQWYKPDVVYRFYTYHTLATALQLEDLPVKDILLLGGKFKKVKDYSGLLPVITLIWMVDDTLNSSEDYISYSLMPEKAKILFEETDIWKNKDIENIIKDILKTYNNDSKGLNFLRKNRLIFAFQKNIIKRKKFAKYSAWFTLAEKTLNKLNEKSDFDEYRNDKIFTELMRLLLKSNLKDEDLEYIQDYEELRRGIELYNAGIKREGVIEGIRQGIEKEKKRNEKNIKKAELERQKAEQERQKAEIDKNIVLFYFRDNKTISEISEITNKSEEYIKKIVNKS